MARDRTSPACGEGHRTTACLADARDHQRHLLFDAGGLSVAPAAERFSVVEHNLSLVCDVLRRGSLREDKPRTNCRRVSVSLSRNEVITLLGSVAPLGVLFLTVPAFLSLIGPERYGVLALVWLA